MSFQFTVNNVNLLPYIMVARIAKYTDKYKKAEAVFASANRN